MNFTSPVFFVFLPTVLLLYCILPKKLRWLLLLAASYLFYAYYDVRLLGLIFLTTLVSWLSSLCMEQAETRRGRKAALAFTLITCLSILFLFKYLNFALDGLFSLCNLLGAHISFQGFDLLLPMGISFYVFQTMSYSLDVYRGKAAAEKHIGYYALFVVFFPQLVAGPIERPGDLLPQLKQAPSPEKIDFAEGFRFLLRGYAKKLLIADYLAGFVDTAYENISTAGGAALLAATLLFALQIYCDFSGYSDIALGSARFLGIRLTENFRNPYRAASIRDFWRRWHISLTRWFTDYLYIPLGGSHRGLLYQCRNIFITFLVSGLWHGADLTFVIWGGLHGIYLVGETLLFRASAHSEEKNPDSRRKFPQQLLTFLLVCLAWIFFRAATPKDAFTVIAEIFTNPQPGNLLIGLGLRQAQLLVLLLLILLLPLLERLPAISFAASEKGYNRQCRTALLYFLLGLAVLICRCLILTGQGDTSFIYFQF